MSHKICTREIKHDALQEKFKSKTIKYSGRDDGLINCDHFNDDMGFFDGFLYLAQSCTVSL